MNAMLGGMKKKMEVVCADDSSNARKHTFLKRTFKVAPVIASAGAPKVIYKTKPLPPLTKRKGVGIIDIRQYKPKVDVGIQNVERTKHAGM